MIIVGVKFERLLCSPPLVGHYCQLNDSIAGMEVNVSFDKIPIYATSSYMSSRSPVFFFVFFLFLFQPLRSQERRDKSILNIPRLLYAQSILEALEHQMFPPFYYKTPTSLDHIKFFSFLFFLFFFISYVRKKEQKKEIKKGDSILSNIVRKWDAFYYIVISIGRGLKLNRT